MSAPKGDLRLLFSKPALPKGRVFTCRSCGDVVGVHEIGGPASWLPLNQCMDCYARRTMQEPPIPYSERGAA